MKRIVFVFLTSILILNGCVVTSFQPFYKKSDLVVNNLLPGQWISKNHLLTFDKLEGEGYTLNYKDCEDAYNAPKDFSTCTVADFTVQLMKLDDHYYMDFYPRSYINSDNLFLAMHVKPTHSLASVSIEKDRLEIRILNYSWLETYLEDHHDKLDHINVDDMITLTASTEELQEFILKHQKDTGFFDDPVVLVRK